MKNLYVFFDSVSGNYGDVFQAENDLVMRRSAIRALASVPPEIARDTVVFYLGYITLDHDGLPSIQACDVPCTAFSGLSPEVEEARSQLMAEAQRYSSYAGGDGNAE